MSASKHEPSLPHGDRVITESLRAANVAFVPDEDPLAPLEFPWEIEVSKGVGQIVTITATPRWKWFGRPPRLSVPRGYYCQRNRSTIIGIGPSFQ